jgi:hypothetical protein
VIGWHGSQPGVLPLAERKLRVDKPRLRRKGPGARQEVEVPAYEAMLANSRLGVRLLEILLKGPDRRGEQVAGEPGVRGGQRTAVAGIVRAALG